MDTTQLPESRRTTSGRFEALRDPYRVRVLIATLIVAPGVFWVNTCWSEQGRIAAICRSLSGRGLVLEKIADRRDRQERLAPLLPQADSDVTSWLDRVRRAAGSCGLESVALRYKDASKTLVGGHRLLGMDMEFEGRFQEAVAFVHWLETSQPRPRPMQFRMEKTQGKLRKVVGRVSFQVLLAEETERTAGPPKARK